MIDIIVFHFNTSQNLVPYLAAFRSNLFNVVRTQLFQVQFRLFRLIKEEATRTFTCSPLRVLKPISAPA